MKFTTIFFMSFLSLNLFSQGNFNVEWESPAGMSFKSFSSYERTNSVPELEFKQGSSIKVYDGATKLLKYTISNSDTFTTFNFTYFSWSTSTIDHNQDGINEIASYKNYSNPDRFVIKIINGVNNNIFFQNTYTGYYGSPYALDIDGDGYVELVLSLYNTTTNEYKLIILSTSSYVISTTNQGQTVTDYKLGQNYPNPFNPSTSIEYSISKDADVQILLYNEIGQLIKTLTEGTKKAGSHKVEFNGTDFASGVYFYQISVDGNLESKKMVLIK